MRKIQLTSKKMRSIIKVSKKQKGNGSMKFSWKRILAGTLVLASFGTQAFAQTNVRVYVNGMRVNEIAFIHNDLTYIPLRAVSEALGANVSWDPATYSAHVAFSEDDAVAQIVEDVSPSVVTIVGNYQSSTLTGQYNKPTAHGTGVIYRANGHIVTNAHVVKDITNLTVVLSNGELHPGSVLYRDETADLAIVKINKVGLKPITMAKKEDVISGRTAIAIGTPISLSMRNSVTKGIVSGVGVALPDSHYKLIQTDATINPGNSGGPLVNIKGELIGINSSKYASVNIDNMGFAIPVDTVETVISQYEIYGRVLRPTLDFTLEQSWEASIGLPTTKGLTVKTSKNATLQVGDTITGLNGIDVHSLADWNEAVKDTYRGTPITVDYTRNGVTYQISVAQ